MGSSGSLLAIHVPAETSILSLSVSDLSFSSRNPVRNPFTGLLGKQPGYRKSGMQAPGRATRLPTVEEVFGTGFVVEEETESLREQGIAVKVRTCSVRDSGRLGVAEWQIRGWESRSMLTGEHQRSHHKG